MAHITDYDWKWRVRCETCFHAHSNWDPKWLESLLFTSRDAMGVQSLVCENCGGVDWSSSMPGRLKPRPWWNPFSKEKWEWQEAAKLKKKFKDEPPPEDKKPSKEIERKFVVPQEYLGSLPEDGGKNLTQAYLCANSEYAVRIRLSSDGAKLGIKAGSLNPMIRDEWEIELPPEKAFEITSRLNLPTLNKTRHEVLYCGATWEVDVIRWTSPEGTQRILLVAEIEGKDPEEVSGAKIPPWVGKEVTGDPRFMMSNLTSTENLEKAWGSAYLPVI